MPAKPTPDQLAALGAALAAQNRVRRIEDALAEARGARLAAVRAAHGIGIGTWRIANVMGVHRRDIRRLLAYEGDQTA